MIDIIRFMTIGCLVVIIYQLLNFGGKRSQLLPATAFACCSAGYLIVDWDPIHASLLYYFFLIAAFGLPYVFWLFSRSIFDDGFRLRPWMIWLGGMVVVLQFFFFFLNNSFHSEIPQPVFKVIRILQYAISLTFVILGISAALVGREADLINSRFKFRNSFILLTAILISLTLLAEIVFQDEEVPIWLELIQKLTFAGLTFYFAFRRLEIKPNFFMESETSPPVIQSVSIDGALLERLNDQMEVQKIWKTDGLTIRQLAEELEVKEYRLRQAINQHLGFRNFNDYLHSYRIEESCSMLSDPQKKDLTILEIAYEVGYKSIAPFNKAFKEITGVTPTEWRRSKNA
ncbi:MAG: helix-turn-helix transcriptional regulator [Lewinellaceae bacterium]|nr:helix-turn-helix transcriptional regulator [Lewinellaceae bacterium]